MLVDNCCSLFEELQRHHILCLISRSKEEVRPEVNGSSYLDAALLNLSENLFLLYSLSFRWETKHVEQAADGRQYDGREHHQHHIALVLLCSVGHDERTEQVVDEQNKKNCFHNFVILGCKYTHKNRTWQGKWGKSCKIIVVNLLHIENYSIFAQRYSSCCIERLRVS